MSIWAGQRYILTTVSSNVSIVTLNPKKVEFYEHS